MSDHTLHGRRVELALPNGERVTVTVTSEILAIAARVREALASGARPAPSDIAALMRFASEDT